MPEPWCKPLWDDCTIQRGSKPVSVLQPTPPSSLEGMGAVRAAWPNQLGTGSRPLHPAQCAPQDLQSQESGWKVPPAQSSVYLAPICSTAGQPGLHEVGQGGVCKASRLPTRGRQRSCQAAPAGIWSLGSWGCPWEEWLSGGSSKSQSLCQAGLLLEPLHPESNLGTHRQPGSQALQMQLILTCCCTLIVKPFCCQLAKSLPP